MRSNRIRTTALAATALLAALSLTACSDNGSGDNGKAGAAAPAGSTADQQSPADATPDTGKDADSKSNAPAKNAASTSKGSTGATGGQKNNTGATGNTGNSGRATCIGENTKVTVSKVSRPINHLLLTMTNTGSRICDAYNAPKLQFDDAQAVFRIIEDSQPQAVVTLDPGQSAYAAIGLTGDTEMKDQHKATHLTVHFSAKDASGSTGTAPDELTLPANTYWDEKGYVTYWQSDMADALTY
ncbi:DUF4232 domain-containing protein [Streptomyces sp. NPDC048473]|uniref:DUF4232 domain-containing protein n=1 Tax=unclassified Streptomyces TaxID=2593676 RepID=UPI003722F812